MSDKLSHFYTTSNPIEPASKPFPQEPFNKSTPDVHSRLQEIDSKLNRLHSILAEGLSRLQLSVNCCQRSIEAFQSGTSQELSDDPQRNDSGPSSGRSESLAEQMLSSSEKVEPEFKKVKGKRLSRVYGRLKQSVRKVFSGPCVVTPIFEIYPARMFQKPAGAKSGGGHQ